MFDISRLVEVAFVLLAALSATAARVIYGVLDDKEALALTDPKAIKLWRRRLSWAIAGEISAIITFVMVAEAIVIYRNWSSPVAVLIGAGAAVLGYPFLAGMFRRRVERRFNQEDSVP